MIVNSNLNETDENRRNGTFESTIHNKVIKKDKCINKQFVRQATLDAERIRERRKKEEEDLLKFIDMKDTLAAEFYGFKFKKPKQKNQTSGILINPFCKKQNFIIKNKKSSVPLKVNKKYFQNFNKNKSNEDSVIISYENNLESHYDSSLSLSELDDDFNIIYYDISSDV